MSKKPEDASQEAPKEETADNAQEYLDGWKRCKADYENLVRETDQRVSAAVKYGTEQLLLELLPSVDHFNYAFKSIPEEERDSGWLTGIEHIQTNFLKVLEEHGVEMIKSVGEKFDPQLHEAAEEVEGGESGIIAEELTAGFRLNGKVVRVATVKVYK